MSFRQTGCDALECPHPHYGRGYCRLHYKRLVGGLTLDVPRKGSSWLQVNNSQAAHRRVKRMWGAANQYQCVTCDKTATSWAYDGTDPTEVYATVGSGSRSYSPDGEKYWSYYSSYPEFYMPMCGSCHSRRDGKKARDDLREYREWMAMTGLRVTDLHECGSAVA